MNADLMQKALEKVGNSNTLINIVSSRVRQLNADVGGIRRPLIADTASLGVADIALHEIIEGKIGWELSTAESPRWVKRKRSRNRLGTKDPRPSMLQTINDAAA